MRILKINSLQPVKKGWVDRDEIMLHACFQILEDFVEKENGLNHCDYEEHKALIDEIRFLYDWWQKRKELEYFLDKDLIDIEDDKMLHRLMKIRLCLWT